MRIRSKLADVDFQFGDVKREGNILTIASHADARMRSKVYVTPMDVTAFLGRILTSPSALLFILGLPWFYYRARREAKKPATRQGR